MSESCDTNLYAAEKIAAHAKRINAGRVTFRDPTGFLFSDTERDKLLDFLQTHSPLKYKLQRLEADGRWKDASKYYPIPSSLLVIESLRSLDLSSARTFSDAEFNRAAEADPHGFQLALRRIFGRVAVAPKQHQLRAWSEYFGTSSHGEAQADVVFLRSTLELLSIVLSHGVDDQFRPSALDSAIAAIGAKQDEYVSDAEQIAYSLIEGKLLSFLDRNAAAAAFGRATSFDSQKLLDRFYFDTGAYTYFAPNTDSTSSLVDEIQAGIQPLQVTDPKNALAVAVSVDAHFFRIYAPQLYLFAQQLPELDFVFLICGDEIEVDEALNDGESYVRHLARLNQSGTPHNIQYLHAHVPASVGQHTTFYACARFFAAERLLQCYKRVYLMDADLVAEDNPTSYFDRIKSISFGTATNGDLSRLSPWRRNLAGNVALSGNGALEQILPDLLEYIARGLTMERSWMLDQNALAFAVEQHPEGYTPLDEFRRPFNQPKFRATWEKRHFASLKHEFGAR